MKQFDLKWISTTLFVTCGTIVALRLPFMKYAFPGFVIAHAVLIEYFWKIHPNRPLLLQNIYFFFINIIATYMWLIKG